MLVARTLPDLRAACASLRATHGSLGFVPTMGALHEGHRALVRASVASGAATVASIFVNPLQFAPTEDLSRYPRDEAGDLAALEAEGCDLAWLPAVATMYPPDDATTVIVTGPAERWEGDARPGHFRGVATVCARLFGQVRPDRAYFGEKDWQQLQVVKRMVADLLLPLEIIGIETVREADGLAMSSRNRFLTSAERTVAPMLHTTLLGLVRTLGRRNPVEESRKPVGESRNPVEESLGIGRQKLLDLGFDVNYLALVDGPSLTPIGGVQAGCRLIAAAKLGTVRLLDNVAVTGAG